MGEVYQASDTRLGRTVAVKILPAHIAADPLARERFEREAKTISSLDHPHICPLFDVGEADGVSYLVMPYLDGETLAARLARGPLALADTLRVAIQVSDALDKAHRQGIVHRDLKPGNVFLVRRSAAPEVKLLDFGLAKTGGGTARTPAAAAAPTMVGTTPPNLTTPGTILGTFQYMAPEQIEEREADARTDLFAFGAVVYEMATGQKAFEGRSQASVMAAILDREPAPLSSLVPLVPAAFERLVRKCLAKDPDERWQTARDLLDELRWIEATPATRGPFRRNTAGRPRGRVRAVARRPSPGVRGGRRVGAPGAVGAVVELDRGAHDPRHRTGLQPVLVAGLSGDWVLH